jgi:hypothetical protein
LLVVGVADDIVVGGGVAVVFDIVVCTVGVAVSCIC